MIFRLIDPREARPIQEYTSDEAISATSNVTYPYPT